MHTFTKIILIWFVLFIKYVKYWESTKLIVLYLQIK